MGKRRDREHVVETNNTRNKTQQTLYERERTMLFFCLLGLRGCIRWDVVETPTFEDAKRPQQCL